MTNIGTRMSHFDKYRDQIESLWHVKQLWSDTCKKNKKPKKNKNKNKNFKNHKLTRGVDFNTIWSN